MKGKGNKNKTNETKQNICITADFPLTIKST